MVLHEAAIFGLRYGRCTKRGAGSCKRANRRFEPRGLKNKRGEARFILSSETGVSMTEIAKILKGTGKFDQYPIPLEVDGNEVPLAKYSHARAEKYLGISFLPIEQTIAEGVESIAAQMNK